ncbi:hypothetical protein FHE25_21440 [Salmonella enterica]|nr:hypothetical protein [Salmonella enterica]
MYYNYSARFENGMLAAYAENSTVPLFLIMPGPSSRFFIQGNVLMHDSKTQATQEIYRASTPESAADLLEAIQRERRSRMGKRDLFALKILCGVLVVICLYLFVTTQFTSNDRQAVRLAPPPFPPDVSELTEKAYIPEKMKEVPPAAMVPQSTAPVEQAMPERSVDTQAIRAASLKKAADSGRYTIALSSGHARTIYVFSDPLCPHCREIEPTLEALTRDYNVVIFPVTLVGKQDTVAAVSPLLCSAPLIRAPLWENIFRPGIGPSPATPDTKGPGPLRCADGDHAISVNDRAFDYYQLPGTPQLIADDGRDIPFSALTSDDALASFMNAPIQGVNDANR